MGIPQIYIFLSFLIVGIVTLGWKALNWVWLKPKRLEWLLKKQGFVGNSYKFLVGDTKDIVEMLEQAKSKPIDFDTDIATRVNPFHYLTVEKYGKNSFFWFGPTPRVFIMDPDHIREILNKMDDFQKIISPLNKHLVVGLLKLEGQKWAKHRKILNPAFRAEKLKLMIPAFYQSCNDMINKWEELVPEVGSVEVDVWPNVQTLSSDAISRTAFGSNYEEGRRIFELLKQLAILFVKLQQSVHIPGSRFLPSKVQRRMSAVDNEIKDSIKVIINKREKLYKAGEPLGEDLLGILMESNLKEMEEKGNNKEYGISTQDMIDECKLFYFAGQETTSTLIVWTMVLLSKHLDWQERARAEVIQVIGSNTPDSDGLNHLKVVTMILHEVLRLYPPVVALIRTVREDTKLGNFILPAGVQVFLPTILIQHDQELWGKDAIEFKPERFLEGVSKATNNQVSFFPFSWGPRFCIGQNFALMEAKIAIAMILQRFSFELSPSYTHAPHTVITLQPQHGAHLILKRLQVKEF